MILKSKKYHKAHQVQPIHRLNSEDFLRSWKLRNIIKWLRPNDRTRRNLQNRSDFERIFLNILE